jgi:hypothetical protein
MNTHRPHVDPGLYRGLIDFQIDAIAEHHHQTGEPVWHSLHVVLDTPVCHCVACQRKERTQ